MRWMIYGANGYTAQMIARQAVRQGLKPLLAGRSADKLRPLADELDLAIRAFALDDAEAVRDALKGIGLVLHCAGPFSVTSKPMIEACLAVGAHYLDISGEIDVFEHALAPAQATRAREAGVVLCPGVGFDVIPTDCVALKLKQLLPRATHLSLGFETASGLSPGTAKTMIEGMGQGSTERRNGRLVRMPYGHGYRRIDFGSGSRSAMSIPWGDVSTAYYTTGIPNIDTWVPMPRLMVIGARLLNILGPLLAAPWVQRILKKMAERLVKGPGAAVLQKRGTCVWGEARDDKGAVKTVRIRVANIYSMTVHGALAVVTHLLEKKIEGGSYTPAKLFGPRLIEQLPGSGAFQTEAGGGLFESGRAPFLPRAVGRNYQNRAETDMVLEDESP